jgi:pimeloyl-ACP methyl ester carboxylesterase
MGARNAIVYAERYAHRLFRLILEDPGPIRRPATGSPLNDVLEREKRRPPTFASLEEAVEFVGDEPDLRSTQPRRAYWNREAIRQYAVGALRQRADGAWVWKYSREAIQQIIASRTEEADREVFSHLRQISVPTLLVRGGDSPVCPPSNAEALRKGIPNCRVAEVEGAGHNVHQQKPAEFLVPILQFLSE